MASASKASWIVAASISAVECLKDQGGLCRWNYAMRSLHQKVINELSSFSLPRRLSSSSSCSSSSSLMARGRAERANKREESLRKVMYLTCWGPN